MILKNYLSIPTKIKKQTMLFREDIEHKLLFRLALIAFVWAIFVVVLGAFTRLVDAGLGCPDWPGCYGHLLWPDEAHEIAKAEEKFPDAPVEIDKTWPEMVHRYFAGSLGLLILAITIISIRQVRQNQSLQRVPVKLSIALLLLVILQAAFGMWTVTLKLWPKVVTAHLLGGFATLSLLWLLVQRLGSTQWQLSKKQIEKLQALKPLLIVALLVVIAQIALGGWVSSNYAALACPDLPQCLGQWIPPTDFHSAFNVWQEVGPNYLGGQLDNEARTAIHLTHRIGACIVVLVIALLVIKLWKLESGSIQDCALFLSGTLLLQLTLGVGNVLLQLPLSVAVAHNAVAAVLLLGLVSVLYRTYSAEVIEIQKNN
jgi:cytochrome c oxidase assembly protein subunit 15